MWMYELHIDTTRFFCTRNTRVSLVTLPWPSFAVAPGLIWKWTLTVNRAAAAVVTHARVCQWSINLQGWNGNSTGTPPIGNVFIGVSWLRLVTLAGRAGRNDNVDCSGSIKSILEIMSLSSSCSKPEDPARRRLRFCGLRLLFLPLRCVIIGWWSVYTEVERGVVESVKRRMIGCCGISLSPNSDK